MAFYIGDCHNNIITGSDTISGDDSWRVQREESSGGEEIIAEAADRKERSSIIYGTRETNHIKVGVTVVLKFSLKQII